MSMPFIDPGQTLDKYRYRCKLLSSIVERYFYVVDCYFLSMSKKLLLALCISIAAHLAVVIAFGRQEAGQVNLNMGAVQAPVTLRFSTVTPPPPEPEIEKVEEKPEPEPEPIPEPVEHAKPVLEAPEPEPEKEQEEIEQQPESEPVSERTTLEESEVDGLSNEPVMVSKPAIRNWVEPRYPRAAQRRNQQGVVMLDVIVDEEGNPLEISILTSSGFTSLDEAAIAAISRWEFEPEQQHNRFVKSRVHIPVAFQLN